MDNPSTETTGQEIAETDLLELAMKADAGEIGAHDPLEVEPESLTPKEKSHKESEEQSKDAAEDPDKGPETKKADEEGKEIKEEEKPLDESKYAKAKKELERQDRSWKKLEEEKATLRAEREKYEQERRDIEATKARSKEYRDKSGYTAEEYDEFAKRTEDPDLYERAKEKAEALRREEQEARATASQEDFHKAWKENTDALLKEDPDLKDPQSEIGKALNRVLAERLVFSATPDGIKHAYAFAKAQNQASLVSGLSDEVKSLKQENERLNKLTGLSGNGPTKRTANKSFDEMSSDEQGAALEFLAAQADGGAH